MKSEIFNINFNINSSNFLLYHSIIWRLSYQCLLFVCVFILCKTRQLNKRKWWVAIGNDEMFTQGSLFALGCTSNKFRILWKWTFHSLWINHCLLRRFLSNLPFQRQMKSCAPTYSTSGNFPGQTWPLLSWRNRFQTCCNIHPFRENFKISVQQSTTPSVQLKETANLSAANW